MDPSYVANGGRIVLLGGLNAADTSVDTGSPPATGAVARSAGCRPRCTTPPRRCSAAASTSSAAATGASQLDEIVRVDPRSGTRHARRPAARRRAPTPTAAAIGGTAYVVGGYTGTRWLDTIVAWRPGHTPRVVAHLPHPLRYAAVAAVGKTLVIAGGSLENGTASDAVLAFTPATGRVTQARHAAGPDDARRGGGARRRRLRDRRPRRDDRTRRRPRSSPSTSPRERVRAAGHAATAALRPRRRHARRARSSSSAAASATRHRRDRLTSSRRVDARGAVAPRSRSTPRTSTPPTAPAMLARRRAARAAARLRPEQRQQHGRRDRPAHATRSSSTSRSARCRSTSSRPGTCETLYVTNDTGNSLTPIDPRTGKPGTRRSRSTTRTTCTSRPTAATRSSSPSGCTGSTSATRTRSSCTTRSRVPVRGRRPHGLLRRRTLPDRELRVLGPARQGRRRHASASSGTLDLPDGAAACRRT